MSQISLDHISLSYGYPPLLQDINLVIEQGERVCIVGRNGCGKTTLLKILSGDIQADSGQLRHDAALVIARVQQEVPEGLNGSVYEIVSQGLAHIGDLLSQYQKITEQLAENTEDTQALYQQLETLQQQIDLADGWDTQSRIDTAITKLKLIPDWDFASLSGGVKRRVLLAQALVKQPDVLLLDEPTNHLDIESIEWLEKFLLAYKGTVIFITHDRAFLRSLATCIVEIDRAKLTAWPGDYDNYQRLRAAQLEAEERQAAEFDKKLAKEEKWIRQGIKARRTRNEGRVRALQKMREQRRTRRERQGTASINLRDAKQSGKRVIEAQNISMAYEGKLLIQNFSTTIIRGDKVGILGPNGAGKTTLLQILLDRVKPDTGSVKLGTNLEIIYFDQLRDQLDYDLSVQDNVNDGKDQVIIGDKTKHVIGYLQDFLFTPDRARSPVSSLSGGERNRLLLAKLFAKPANLLVLDEPTNDLDAETLELLESLVVNFTGTVLLVSHDRAFINNVVTSCIVFEGEGKINEYVGGYEDWLRQRPSQSAPEVLTKKSVQTRQSKPLTTQLSSQERKELLNLPAKIEKLEVIIEECHQKMAEPEFYAQPKSEIDTLTKKLREAEENLESAFERWQYLEEIANQRL